MIREISNELELEFLKLHGIELVDEKLIKVETGEEFIPVNPEKIKASGEYHYKYGDTIVIFRNHFGTPLGVIIQDKGIEYFALDWIWDESLPSWRQIKIKRIESDKFFEIGVKPMYNEFFIVTSFTRQKEYIEYEKFNILCDFSNIYRDNFSRGDLSLEIYEEVLKENTNYFFRDEQINEAYLKCVPFLCNGFAKLIDFPVDYQKNFKEYFDERVAELYRQYCFMIINRKKERDEALELGDNKTMGENAIAYLEEASKFEAYICDRVEHLEADLEQVALKRKKFEAYLESRKKEEKRIIMK